MYVVWRLYGRASERGQPYAYHSAIEPVAYTLSSALFGGGQMIVHTKLVAELFELNLSGGEFGIDNKTEEIKKHLKHT